MKKGLLWKCIIAYMCNFEYAEFINMLQISVKVNLSQNLVVSKNHIYDIAL